MNTSRTYILFVLSLSFIGITYANQDAEEPTEQVISPSVELDHSDIVEIKSPSFFEKCFLATKGATAGAASSLCSLACVDAFTKTCQCALSEKTPPAKKLLNFFVGSCGSFCFFYAAMRGLNYSFNSFKRMA